MKIIDKLIDYPFDFGFSLEFFPPKTEEGIKNQEFRVQRFMDLQGMTKPLFIDLTWGAGGSTSDLTLDLSTKWLQHYGAEVNMHLTCTNMSQEKIDQALEHAKNYGIQNIVALRGDPPIGKDRWTSIEGGFTCALDLVKYIRSKYGDYFCITVSGYPEGHPNKINEQTGICSPSDFEDELKYLKEKVDAGADLIITQLFYDVELFNEFVNRCRQIGINCPILPGIMLVQSYDGFHRMTKFCKTRVPQNILDRLELLKDNSEAMSQFGEILGIEMCKQLILSGHKFLHLYTLNKDEPAMTIIEKIVENPI